MSSCLPSATPKSDRYQDVIAGMVSGLTVNCLSVIILFYPHMVVLPPAPASAGILEG